MRRIGWGISFLAPIKLPFLSPIVCEGEGMVDIYEKEEVRVVARGVGQTTQKQRMEEEGHFG